MAVTGPSGSGKTTFLNIAGLLDTFEHGSYVLDGEDVSRLSDDQMSRIRNRKIGFVFQSFNRIPDLDVFDNVDVPLRHRGLPAPERKQRIERALELVGLSSRLHHLPSRLSGGQQQRVAIARVLAGTPRLILADEPGAPPPQITYGDMRAIMQTEIPERQSAAFRARLTVYPERGVARPLQAAVRMCFSDFFTMFEVPFAHGAPWDRKADAGPEPVVVI